MSEIICQTVNLSKKYKGKVALEKVNIEFTENNGVRKKTDTIRVLRGQKEYMAFFDMVYEFVKKNNEPIYLNNVDETYYERWYPGFYQSEYVRKMRQLGKKLDFRITVKEGNNYFPVKEYATYRWLPENQFSPIAFEVFGGRFITEPGLLCIEFFALLAQFFERITRARFGPGHQIVLSLAVGPLHARQCQHGAM